jgi:hypothetical protein
MSANGKTQGTRYAVRDFVFDPFSLDQLKDRVARCDTRAGAGATDSAKLRFDIEWT